MIVTKPIFILASGRSGTYSIYKSLKREKRIESHHEFYFEKTLRNSVLYYLKKKKKKELIKFINSKHGLSIKKSNKKYWVDSSNALPWITDVLYENFPNAKFVHLVRNGKKVVSSFYYKLKDIMYNKRDIIKLYNYLNSNRSSIPSKKKYWRPIPHKSKKDFNYFLKAGQFYRICCYWRDVNKNIRKHLNKVPKKNKLTFNFENIEKEKKIFELFNFLGIPKKRYRNVLKKFKKPINVRTPKNFYLTKKQLNIFDKVCGKEMIQNGYLKGTKEYEVIY
tara:strand:- start:835 stop:1668 length:834 start_codon:yes stop_codon:yes gene_type:complete